MGSAGTEARVLENDLEKSLNRRSTMNTPNTIQHDLVAERTDIADEGEKSTAERTGAE